MSTSWIHNSLFYSIIEHFSLFYICCITVSLVTVIFTWYYNSRITAVSQVDESTKLRRGFSSEFEKDHVKSYELNVMSHMKRAKQKAIEKILKEELTEEQLELEKQVESKQLSEIFKLLQDQEDKFKINTEEELQEQLKLYRSQ